MLSLILIPRRGTLTRDFLSFLVVGSYGGCGARPHTLAGFPLIRAACFHFPLTSHNLAERIDPVYLHALVGPVTVRLRR